MNKKQKLKNFGGIQQLLLALEDKELQGKNRLLLKALRPMNLRYSHALKRLFADKRLIKNLPPVETIAEPVTA